MSDLRKSIRDISYQEMMTFCDVILVEHKLDRDNGNGKPLLTASNLANTIFEWASYSDHVEEAAE